MNARDLLDQLISTSAVRLIDLPKDFGIYALRDHEQRIRYIGCTHTESMGFRRRIFNYHRSGNEGQSHKFSQAYCTGRMWRFKKTFHGSGFEYLHDEYDANVAKKLRNDFVERFCTASYVAIEGQGSTSYFARLQSLEAEVQRLAAPEMRRWERKLFREEDEPEALTDLLIAEGVCLDRAAADRQRERYNSHMRNR